jgi:hypothetical protein
MRNCCWLLAGLVLVCLIGVSMRWLMEPPGITFINYCKLRKGMTEREATEILGPPAISRVGLNGKPFAIWKGMGSPLVIDAEFEGPQRRIYDTHFEDESDSLFARIYDWIDDHFAF